MTILVSICIVSPSPTQCVVIRDLIPKKHRYRIEILKAYDIQGRQFRAIFISTSELTTANGEAINQTKSISDRYIFNTVITRSQSLVVAVGNPFQLLKAEKNMIKRHGSEAKCWTPYIKQCIECNTFSLSSLLWKNPNETKEARINLFNQIYSRAELTGVEPTSIDSIIKAYQEVFSCIPECKKAKIILASGKDSSRLSWKIDDSPHKRDTNQRQAYHTEKYMCVLNIENFRNVKAIPIDNKKRIVKILGPRNRKGAFDGDTVKVGVFKDKRFGQVIEVVPRGNTGDLKFMCRVNPDNPIVFYPIDGKNPQMINMPRLSRDLLLKKDKVNLRDIIEKHLKSSDVVVFDSLFLDSNQEGVNPLPRIKQVIPISVASNMVFLVAFVKWDPRYRGPLGMVVGAFPRGYTPFFAERLLKCVHSVDYNEEGSLVALKSDPALPVLGDNLAFTIDPEGAQNLDDALSLIKIRSHGSDSVTYKLGVHIVNAAKHIAPDSHDDKVARTRGTSIYGGEKGNIMHMLPYETRCRLSLSPGKVRDVISVTCEVTIRKAVITIGKAHISPSQIRSALQLTYDEAQSIMNGNTVPAATLIAVRNFDKDSCDLPLRKTLSLMYDLARAMSRNRLKCDAAYCYEAGEDADLLCWQAHMMVGELMIWANSEVAKSMHDLYPGAAILRRQRPPDNDELSQHIRDNKSVIDCSLYLSRYSKERSIKPIPLLVPLTALEQIHDALNSNNNILLSSLFSSDRLYPQLSCVQSRLRSLYPRAEYCCADKNNSDLKAYEHSSLCLHKYTHFTSPLRRYADIEVQRMVLELSSSSCQSVPDDHTKLCCSLNKKMRNASEFEKSMKYINLAFEFTNCSESYTAYISQVSKGMVELIFPQLELHHFPSRERKLKLNCLGPFSRKVGKKDSPSDGIYKWNARITSLHGGRAASVLQSSSLLVSHIGVASNRAMSLDVYKCLNASKPSSTLSKEKFQAKYQNELMEVSPACWLKMTEFVKNPDCSMNGIKKYLSHGPPLLQSKPIDLDPKQIYLHLECDMAQSLKESDVLKVWLTWSIRNPVISPAIQLVELSPLLRICVQHNSHPAECFSDPNLSQASRPVYASITDYVESWKRVLLAEAAEKSVKECQLVIMRDVHLEWPNLVVSKRCLDQHYYIPTGAVVMHLSPEFVIDCYEFFKFNVGDLVCARYGCDSPHTTARAVFHFVVHVVSTIASTGEIRIQMQSIGDISCRVSEKIKLLLESNPTSEVQIISLSSSYRRVFSGLLELSQPRKVTKDGCFTASDLSKCVAMDHSRIKIYNGELQIPTRDEFALSISRWNSKKNDVILNEFQNIAMRYALTKSFQLIQGPPGTGKSETGAHIAYVFANHNKILNRQSPKSKYKCVLYCGPSNKSVDVVLKKFYNLLLTRDGPNLRILRVYSKTVETKNYPGPSQLSYKTDYKCPKWAEKFALHHIVRGMTGNIFSEVLRLDKMFQDMRDSGSIASGTLCHHYRQTLSKAEKKILLEEQFDIVLCTCNEASGDRIKSNIFPRQCIIDECGMAYEPETIVPISLCEHAVLIGDHMQLQPVIDYRPAKDCGLSTSLFERYAQTYGQKYTYTLKIQYRMHKEICAFPSKYFYDGKLQTDKSITMRNNPETKLERFWPRGKRCPIVFVNLVGEEEGNRIGTGSEKNIGTDSKFNMKEAEKTIEIAEVLHTVHHVPVAEIAILTPYSAQKNKIQELVNSSTVCRRVKVASINESQGDEYGIVILSTVRTRPLDEIKHSHYVQADRKWLLDNLGFITDKHQINVGITRSKYGLVIIGNKMLLEYDDTWKELLKHYKKKECIVDDTQFPA